jgi:glycerol kinase
MVPAFLGLGAPWWDSDARGAFYGLSRTTRRPELIRAAMEAVGYQSRDMIDAMRKDLRQPLDLVFRVDGGMVASEWTMQFLADILDLPVDSSRVEETTALGAAWLAGWKAGVWPDAQGFAARREQSRQFNPRMSAQTRKQKLRGWHDAVHRTLSSSGMRKR